MREIKFRAWNKEKEIMVYGNEDDSEEYWDGVISSDVDMVNSLLRYNPPFEYIWMQYTGLKDENGRVIYEGDVVKFKSVYYENKIMKAVVKFNGSLGSFVFDRGDDLGPWRIDASMREIEVIGNVYQNPELLEAAEEC
ncbi:YopX family protein [Bacillus haynesii]|uniref:YopX family protein n=1 Tax=Bacillus haynesii TaxID=1925021 RepID=UPI002DB74B3C|nr:YopX family protein [Bacillus haynesii]MEC1479235.1 YopX family protein [Bacillus haynesii]